MHITHSLWHAVAALLAGASLPLAFAPIHWLSMAFVSLAILFRLWLNATPRQAGWLGFWFGIGCFGLGVSWVYISLHEFGGMHPVAASLLTVLFILALALYPAGLGWLLSRYFPRPSALKLLLLMPTAWVLIEWLRGWFLTGFPWLQLGYSQIDTPLSQLAPITGVLGVSFLVAWIAGVLAYASLSRQRLLLALPLLAALGGGSLLLQPLSWTQPSDEPLQVALIQANTPEEYLERLINPYNSIFRYLSRSSLAAPEADLIIWPETAMALFYNEAGDYLDLLQQIHERYGTDFLLGMFSGDLYADEYYNSLVSVGSHSGRYSKHRLVPFGEFIPLYSWFGALFNFIDVPVSNFSRGDYQQPPLQAAGQTLGISICYEDAFGEQMRTHLPEASLLVNISNDSWFGDSLAPHQHLQIARMRALESGRYLLRATNTGISAVINPQGQITARSPQLRLHTLHATAQPYQGSTPYIRFGDSLIVSMLLLLFVLGALIYRLAPAHPQYRGE